MSSKTLGLILLIFVESSCQVITCKKRNIKETLTLFLSQQASTPSSPSYEAGVVEFFYDRFNDLNDNERLKSSQQQYLDIMRNAPANLDIIVFPEATLNNFGTAVEIPLSAEKIAPCKHQNFNESSFLSQISCSAKQFQRYVVINIATKAKCPDPQMIANSDPRKCSDRDDGFSYYNTNVVFNRNGEIIARYRKFNLFGEKVDRPSKPELVTFDTDFGVKFGTFICFDLMFRRPALALLRDAGVTDVVFTANWYSELPFLTAVQAQQNWAHSNNVNFLAAGGNNPVAGSTGSGIYAAQHGSLVSVMQGIPETKLYTATVPKRTNANAFVLHKSIRYVPEHMKTLKLKRDHLDRYDTVLIENANSAIEVQQNITITHNSVKCVFRIRNSGRMNTNSRNYRYRAAAYDGNRTFSGFADGGVATCAIFACLNTELSSCGLRDETYESNIEWTSIQLYATMPTDSQGQYFYMPTTLDTSIMPLGPESFFYSTTSAGPVQITFVMVSNGSLKDLLTFGIYGRNFNLDSRPDDKDDADASNVVVASWMLVTSITFATIWCSI